MPKNTDPYAMRTPCVTCPFRTDIPPYLTPERVEEIERSLDRSEFPCHKTVDYSKDDDGEEDTGHHTPQGGEIHCAGALILMEKEGRSSQMTRIAMRLGMYDPRKLDMEAPVFDSFDEMIEAQDRPKPKPKKKAAKRHLPQVRK